MKCLARHHSKAALAVAILLLCCCVISLASEASSAKNESHVEEMEEEKEEKPEECHGKNRTRYEVASLLWEEVEVPFGICIWIMIASLAKLGFHYTRLPDIIPESCLLIIIGVIVGGIISINPDAFPDSLSTGLESELFFLFLLPPIMLEAGYFMPARSFFDNIGTILLYAVIGTLFNTFTIGFSLYGISELGWYGPTLDISLLECLTFSSLISAVDPVAVLAVFEEIHVNEVLYILVFGESLLNDAVTVVLYRMFEAFNSIGAENLQAIDIVAGFFSFFVVAIGGVLIGLLYGFLTALLTRFTHKARVIEPIFVFAMAYMAYLTAEMFRLSSILSIVFCAIFMKPYVEANISQKSHTTIKYFLKMLSSISETIIFIFLGVNTLVDIKAHQWNTVFVIFTLIFCLVYRTIGVIIQTWVANAFRLARIAKTEQFIMSYGGLRGAIAFSLVALLCAQTVLSKPVMFTTCIVVVMFTVFIQGTTIKPLVNKLHVRKATKHKPSMNEEIFERMDDHLMVGIEEILGQYGHHHWREKWEHFNTNYIEPVLILEKITVGDPKILEVFSKLNEKDALDYVKSHGSFAIPHDQSMGSMLRNQSSDILPTVSFGSGLPLNDSVPCLDMHQIETTVPKKLVQDSSSHHLELLANNMYRPKTVKTHQKSRHMGDDIPEPPKLMHRSMKLQLRRISKKHQNKQQQHPHGGRTLHGLAVQQDRGKANSAKLPPLNHGGDDPNLAASASHPALIVTPEEEEDEGITFKARDASDIIQEIDALASPPDLDVIAGEAACSPTACEKVLPWKVDSDAEVSVRAEINPHEFQPLTPPTPLTPLKLDGDGDDDATPHYVYHNPVDSLLINGLANDGSRETRL